MTPTKQQPDKNPDIIGDGSISWDIEGQHSGALLDFMRLMRGHSGFSLIFLQYNDLRYIEKLIPHLNRHATTPTTLRIDPEMDFSGFEQRLFDLSVEHDLIHVIGLNEWLAGESREAMFRGFNYHRELIAERARVALALWMTEDDIRDFALKAPDMWAWRKGGIDFSVVRRERDVLEQSRIDLGSADLNERRQRMEEIQVWLADHQEENISRANLLSELGQIQHQLGEVDEALLALCSAGEIFRLNDYKRDYARGIGDIAEIYFERGDVDKALKLNEEILQIFETLGDKRSCAATLGAIARIYAYKGDVDKALNLYKEMLQVYESLGDKRSRAMTLGDIARIYVHKGDAKEALMLHEEELEVYESLGDKHSRAVVLGDIARIHIDKGDVEKALKLNEERLNVYEKLEDVSGIANALWISALVYLQKEDFKKALPLLTRSYQILLKLGHLQGICSVGQNLGELLCATDKKKRGIEILRRSEEGWRKLGRDDLAAKIRERIGSFHTPKKTHEK